MARLITGAGSTPARKLQIRVKGSSIQVVDKETQQLIAGVANWEIRHNLDFQPIANIHDFFTDRVKVRAKIEIIITDPADIFVEPDTIDGTIVDAPLALPAPVLVLSEESANVFIEGEE